MDADDKKILEFLKKNEMVKAPEDFTKNVMNTIVELEDSKGVVFQLNTFSVTSFVFMVMAISVGVFYYFDNTIFDSFISYFTFTLSAFGYSTSWFENYFILVISFLAKNKFALIIGIGLIALLSFDKLFLRRKIDLNMLTIV